MKSPRAKTLPFTVNLIADKSGLPTSAAISGVSRYCKRSHYRRERTTDYYANRHVHYVATQNKLFESAHHRSPPKR
jgi:hypothetical protein